MHCLIQTSMEKNIICKLQHHNFLTRGHLYEMNEWFKNNSDYWWLDRTKNELAGTQRISKKDGKKGMYVGSHKYVKNSSVTTKVSQNMHQHVSSNSWFDFGHLVEWCQMMSKDKITWNYWKTADVSKKIMWLFTKTKDS